ncbi:Uncharacterised protein g8542 [Pycnogonum litorale]
MDKCNYMPGDHSYAIKKSKLRDNNQQRAPNIRLPAYVQKVPSVTPTETALHYAQLNKSEDAYTPQSAINYEIDYSSSKSTSYLSPKHQKKSPNYLKVLSPLKNDFMLCNVCNDKFPSATSLNEHRVCCRRVVLPSPKSDPYGLCLSMVADQAYLYPVAQEECDVNKFFKSDKEFLLQSLGLRSAYLKVPSKKPGVKRRRMFGSNGSNCGPNVYFPNRFNNNEVDFSSPLGRTMPHFIILPSTTISYVNNLVSCHKEPLWYDQYCGGKAIYVKTYPQLRDRSTINNNCQSAAQQFLSVRSGRSRSSHLYSFTRKQRLNRYRRLLTGLTKTGCMLQRLCKPCTVVVPKLTFHEINRWGAKFPPKKGIRNGKIVSKQHQTSKVSNSGISEVVNTKVENNLHLLDETALSENLAVVSEDVDKDCDKLDSSHICDMPQIMYSEPCIPNPVEGINIPSKTVLSSENSSDSSDDYENPKSDSSNLDYRSTNSIIGHDNLKVVLDDVRECLDRNAKRQIRVANTAVSIPCHDLKKHNAHTSSEEDRSVKADNQDSASVKNNLDYLYLVEDEISISKRLEESLQNYSNCSVMLVDICDEKLAMEEDVVTKPAQTYLFKCHLCCDVEQMHRQHALDQIAKHMSFIHNISSSNLSAHFRKRCLEVDSFGVVLYEAFLGSTA